MTVRLVELPEGVRGACRVTGPGAGVIVLSQSLDQVERTAALAHELGHLDRGGGCSWPGAPATWAAVEAREERLVDEGVARDLLPAVELDEWLEARVSAGAQVDARLVSVEWAVPERIAGIALERALVRARARALTGGVERCEVVDVAGVGEVRVHGQALTAESRTVLGEVLAAVLDGIEQESAA